VGGLRRVLVANRGEIAVRIVRACADAGIESVVAVSEADRASRAALVADRAVCIGPAPATDSYLDVPRVVAAALATGCDAVHPGYGFLAERPELARACAEHGLTFVGPPADVIARGGDKAVARELAASLGIPVGAGSGVLADAIRAATVAEEVGYPVVLKAAAGGGGRGMALVAEPAALPAAFEAASQEARQAFGDGRMYVERFVTRARHVEVQVLADAHGGVVHLGERDCSAQRRYQKLVEEAPAVHVAAEVRRDLCAAAVELAHALRYVGAGTVEFVVDAETSTWSFLEVNTRIQVEHPVTEEVTGRDLVAEQLRIAAGEPLGFTQDEVRVEGHAVEARLTAEDVAHGFRPSPGRLTRFAVPDLPGLRVDTHCADGTLIPPHYDSLMAKLIGRGPDRQSAVRVLGEALAGLEVDGVQTNRDLLRAVLGHADFAGGAVTTKWLEEEAMA